MGLMKFVLISSIVVVILSVVLHEFSPQYLVLFTKSQTVQTLMKNVNSYIKLIKFTINKIIGVETPVKGKSVKVKKPKLFNKEELKLYNGEEGSKGLYLAILGKIFNVKKGKQHYGPGGGYSFFAGKDGSRAFVSGDFTEQGLIDDVSGLSSQDYIGLSDWVSFYEKDYKFVGFLIGKYYDENGQQTSYNIETQKLINDAFAQKEDENLEKKMFPPCNSEWHHESGGRVWCTNKSGGIEREWAGVPRKFKVPGKNSVRCACIKGFGPPSHDPNRINHNNRGDLDNPNLQEYEGCVPDQPTCKNK